MPAARANFLRKMRFTGLNGELWRTAGELWRTADRNARFSPPCTAAGVAWEELPGFRK